MSKKKTTGSTKWSLPSIYDVIDRMSFKWMFGCCTGNNAKCSQKCEEVKKSKKKTKSKKASKKKDS